MQITKTIKKVQTLKDCYVIKVETMQGDADDYHSLELMPENEDELRNMIIHLEIITRCYPDGRGGYDCYVGKYAEEYFEELYNYEGMEDQIEGGYEILYYDENGIVHDVEITLDEDMINEIKNPDMSDEHKEEMSYPSPDKVEVDAVIKNDTTSDYYDDSDEDEE